MKGHKGNGRDCIYCGGEVRTRVEKLDYRYHGQLFIIEDVPLGVCGQCGEKFLSAAVAKKLERLVSTGGKPTKTVTVPVLSLAA